MDKKSNILKGKSKKVLTSKKIDPAQRISKLVKRKNKKILTLQKAETEKSYIVKKIERLAGKKCHEADMLKIQLQKKLKSIRNIKRIIRITEGQIETLQGNGTNKS